MSTNEPLSVSIIGVLRTALLKLDRAKGVSEKVKKGLRVLKSYVGAIKIKYENVEFSVDVDAETGTADSGKLSRDLADLFIAAGEAAKAQETAIIILIDEVQNLTGADFEALIMAIHRTDQKQLPLMVVGAGLPLLIKLTGPCTHEGLKNGKTYLFVRTKGFRTARRIFLYARRGSERQDFHESVIVRLMRSIVATPTLKCRAMARMDWPSLSMV